MQAIDRSIDLEPIMKVFQDLELEEARTREHFRQLARPSELDTRRKLRYEPQHTRSNTSEEGEDN